MKIYCTSYCNQGHNMANGKPVGHECVVVPPAALAAERDGDTTEALRILEEKKPLKAHAGIKAEK
jgi:hypothetical protein